MVEACRRKQNPFGIVHHLLKKIGHFFQSGAALPCSWADTTNASLDVGV
jgi:hypothetical protein